LIVHGDGTQTRDFLHVSDATNSVLRSLTNHAAKGEVFNVGSGQPTSVNSLAKIVLSASNTDAGVTYETSRVGDIKSSFADISKAGTLLDYKPAVSLESGIQDLVSKVHRDRCGEVTAERGFN
jgi:nucleoside-diphosphate-sugar epimerase